LFARDDWQLFLDPATLPQKAGCQPEMLRRIILRELVDNALDAGAMVTLEQDGENAWIITDDGPGISPADVPRLFSVNRPLVSSKRRRLPLRGMLGDGLMGGVAASGGGITVTTRGQRLNLALDPTTGATRVVESSKLEAAHPGLTVRLVFGPDLPRAEDEDNVAADDELAIRDRGRQPRHQLHRLLQPMVVWSARSARVARTGRARHRHGRRN
jgi:hypothetical protein